MSDPQDGQNEGDSFPEIFGAEDEVLEESPRRAASAEFIVHTEVGSATALRDAMDPANQSLADALRLSFRVLQIVILILIALFFGSGIVTVKDSESGVLTRWGKIISYNGNMGLDSGLKFSWWPYPVGEFVLFDVDNLSVDIKDTFLPHSNIRGMSISQHLEKATTSERFRPGVDGALLTSEGDMAHMYLNARFVIQDPVKFVETVSLGTAEQMVKLAIEQATINVVATVTLQDLMEVTDAVTQRIQVDAQQMLDEIGCGIAIRQITLPEPPRPPYAIVRTFETLSKAKITAGTMAQSARQAAETTRSGMAGEHWKDIIDQINAYQNAIELGEADRAEELLVSINDWLDNDAVGQASEIISNAHSYQTIIDSTLGNEAKRFKSLLATFRRHPNLVIRQKWMEASSRVMSMADAEPFIVPEMLGRINLQLSGLDEIRQLRRDMKLDRLGRQAMTDNSLTSPYIMRGRDYYLDGPGRLLDIKDGEVIGQGENRRGNSGN